MCANRLAALTRRLFEVDCAKQNLQARLDRLDDEEASIVNGIYFQRPLYEHETLFFDDLVLILGPRQVEAMTLDQYEKTHTEEL